MSYSGFPVNIDQDVRRLVATATTDKLVDYVQQQVWAGYDVGYKDCCRMRDTERVRTQLRRVLRRGALLLIQRLF